MIPWKKTILSVVLLSLAVLIDGSIMLQFPTILNTKMGIVGPHFLTMVLAIICLYEDDSSVRMLAVIFGFIKDSYYIGFLGIYMIGYFLMVYIIQKARDFLNQSTTTDLLLCFLATLFIENFSCFIYRMLSITQIKWSVFLIRRLGATLFINGLFTVILYFLLNRLFLNLKMND